ncbi:hypothetical protein J3B02_001135 [Coemansia erecta]|uniref:Zinc-finger domain-containing protein n=1 Tax=Coemansia asiatica TaxID=1052880 RepID=A0A9W7XG47_9FUNG|nr:hypothetical protein LPJ64_006010 [Coemansia asiatica]KAJ2857248.1 hypothetical protein J3B02_001135 [Coemansia erecta]KAJ2887403.1 hypothetical protein FB639_001345 [Coemansia asiatica]
MDSPESNYEEERERQIRENALFFASLGIEKPVVAKKVVQKRDRNKENDEDEFKPTREYTIRTRTHKISYNENRFYDDIDWPRKKKSNSGRKGTRNPNPGVRRVGGRIYDPVKGSTCHQCRQKTIDEKICCTNSGCNVMFDIHCLNIRYEDEADRTREAGKESSWICPKCTGKCNCSFCRRKQNKRPTGQLTTFIKNNGVDIAKKELSCDGFSSSALYPEPPKRAKRAFGIDSMYISENEYEEDEDDDDENNDEGNENDNGSDANSDSGRVRVRKAPVGRRYSQRKTKASARQKISAMVTDGESDFEHYYSGASGSVGRAWNGWDDIPSYIDCIVLI